MMEDDEVNTETNFNAGEENPEPKSYSFTSSLSELEAAHGVDHETASKARQVMSEVFKGDEKTNEFLERTQLGNDPELISFMARLGENKQKGAEQPMPSMNDRESEIRRIMSDKTYFKNELWRNGDRATKEEIDRFFKEKYGDKPSNCPTSQRVVIDVPR